MIYKNILKSQTISLRTISINDCNENYVNWLSDVTINQYLETRWAEQTLDKITQFVLDMLNSDHSYLFAIINNKNNKHIGNIKLGPIHPHYGYANIGYFIGDPNYWGKGIATEAVRLITDFAFNELNLRRVQAGAFEKNIGSINVLRKCGFSLEGVFQKQLLDINGQWQDCLFFGRLNEKLLNN